MTRAWWEFIEDMPCDRLSIEVDDVRFVQPVGFVWLSKPRYRVKAGRRAAI